MLPAALLAEALFLTLNYDLRGLRVRFTDLVASVVVSAFTEV